MGKKIFWSILLIFYFLPFLLTLFGGDTKDYEITDYVVDAEILDDGDVLVREYMVFDGKLNGFENDFYYENQNLNSSNYAQYEKDSIYNPSDITNFKISAFSGKVTEKTDDVNYFKEVGYADVGDSGVYTKQNMPGGYKVRIYRPVNNEVVTYYMEYVIEDAVVIHKDIAEFYYNFLSNGFRDNIENVNITINLPNESSGEFRFWGHGGLQGTINGYDNKKIVAEMEEYIAHSDLDIRVVFDKELITNSDGLDYNNLNALDGILNVEAARAEQANMIRDSINFKDNLMTTINIIYLISLLVLLIYIYLKYDREYKSSFQHQYNRDFINDYDVEIVDYLINKKITPNAMSASIMNMIYKKNISFTKLEKDEFLYKLENKDNLSENENNLVEFLFSEVGDGTNFSTKDLKKYASASMTCDRFNAHYKKWKDGVLATAKAENFYEESSAIKFGGILYGLVGIVIWYFSLDYIVKTDFFRYSILISIAFMIYVLAFKRRTKKGNEHFVRWEAFKRFLEDFGNFSIKELPEVILWEKYLVYAVVLGVADKVQKVMNVKIQEMDNDVLTSDTIITYNNFYHMSYVINSSVNSAIQSASRASVAKASANYSSGGGFGGGFSSGGGFGGGGRGGGGF